MLKTINIKNFRSCANTSISFDQAVTALVGRNGVGKTNVLRALQWLANTATRIEPLDSILRFEKGPQGSVDIESTFEINGHKYKYAIQYNHRTEPPYAEHLIESLCLTQNGLTTTLLTRKDKDVTISSPEQAISIGETTPCLNTLLSILPDDHPVLVPIKELVGFLKRTTYYSMVDNTDSRDFLREGEYFEWARQYEKRGESTQSIGLRLLYLWKNDKDRYGEFVKLIGPSGLNVVSQILVHEVPMPARPPDHTDVEKLFFFAFEPSTQLAGAGQHFFFSDLSQGTRRILRILVSILFDDRSLMLLEQPEDSIHPGLLQKIISLLRAYSTETQLVFSTHSAEVLNILNPEDIRLVTAQSGHTSVRDLSDVEISAAHEYLHDTGSLSDFVDSLSED